jgi:hypothetical protein
MFSLAVCGMIAEDRIIRTSDGKEYFGCVLSFSVNLDTFEGFSRKMVLNYHAFYKALLLGNWLEMFSRYFLADANNFDIFFESLRYPLGPLAHCLTCNRDLTHSVRIAKAIYRRIFKL